MLLSSLLQGGAPVPLPEGGRVTVNFRTLPNTFIRIEAVKDTITVRNVQYSAFTEEGTSDDDGFFPAEVFPGFDYWVTRGNEKNLPLSVPSGDGPFEASVLMG